MLAKFYRSAVSHFYSLYFGFRGRGSFFFVYASVSVKGNQVFKRYSVFCFLCFFFGCDNIFNISIKKNIDAGRPTDHIVVVIGGTGCYRRMCIVVVVSGSVVISLCCHRFKFANVRSAI